MIEQKKSRAVVLPKGSFAGFIFGEYMDCSRCPHSEYDSGKEMFWCRKYNGWENKGSGCRHWND